MCDVHELWSVGCYMKPLHVYLKVFPCIKHFTTYHLCCESLETAVAERKENSI